MENIDVILVFSFLAINLAVGLYYGRGVKTIKAFAIGEKKFATTAISASIIATWISGSFFTVSVSQTYKEGVWFIPAAIGDILSLLIISYVLAPRMKEFLESLSVAETMGALFGKNIRIVTALASLAQSIAMTALQIKVFSSVFSYFLDFSVLTATITSSFVVIFYSAWGGIKSVTFTDAVQFFTFGLFIPLFALFVWQTFGDSETVINSLKTNPLLDFSQLLNYKDPRFLPNFSLLLWFLIPSLSSPTFQRTLMAKNTEQINTSFGIAAVGYTFIMLFICLIGLLILSIDPTISQDNIIVYIVDNYAFTGLKAFTIIGIMAMVMSSADSWINVGSVIFAHDLCKPLGITLKNELLLSRAFTLFAGLISVALVLSSSSLFKLFSLQANFYMPIVTMPLILAILGFRSTSLSVGIGMGCGVISVILWKIFVTPVTDIDSVVPSMLANLTALIASHYLFKQSGGWIGRKDKKKVLWPNLSCIITHAMNSIRCLKLKDIVPFFQKYEPKQEVVYSYFAFGSLLSLIVTFSLDKEVYRQAAFTVNLFQAMVLFISTLFFTRNLIWPKKMRQDYIGLIWFLSIFACLSFISSFFVLLSAFSQISLVIFIVHLSMVGILLSWRATLIVMILGSSIAYYLYLFLMDTSLPSDLGNLKLNIIYSVLIVSSFLITFLKPKQEYVEATEAKVDYLSETNEVLVHKIDDYSDKLTLQEKEMARLGETAQRILNNVNHELRLPVGNVMNFAEMLSEGLGKYSEDQLKELSDEVVQNTNRLSSMILNMLDLATLDAKKIELNKRTTNLSGLVEERAKHCFKLYKDNKQLQFKLDIEPEILVKVDPNYIRQTVDNLVINAIRYSGQGTITVTLRKNKDQIIFTITDEGLGIPKEELLTIFEPFQQSSKTTSKAEGRGVGLALCKAAVEAHGGVISADSNGNGARFRFVLPL